MRHWGSDAETARLEAASVMRTPIKDIALTPEGDQLKIDVRGDLAGILAISTNAKGRPERDGLLSQVEMVAGRRNPLCRTVLWLQCKATAAS
jgi:hypothetical protein